MVGVQAVKSAPAQAVSEEAALLPGWYTLDDLPQLTGSRCAACGTYYFPKTTRCRNPACGKDELADVPLSRTGKLWSYTNACYQPPPPFVAAEPFVPFAIAAVELAEEKMIVLGAVVDGVRVEDLRAGMEMTVTLEPLADGKLTWKWKPAP